MIIPHFLILQKLSPNFVIEIIDLIIKFLLLIIHSIKPILKIANLPLDFRVLSAANPLYRIFLNFLNIANPLQHVSNIINPPLLHFEDIDSDIEVDGHILAIFDEIYEFLSEDG